MDKNNKDFNKKKIVKMESHHKTSVSKLEFQNNNNIFEIVYLFSQYWTRGDAV